MHLAARDLYFVPPVNFHPMEEKKLASYTFQQYLLPGEYDILVDSNVEMVRPPFVKFNFRDLRDAGFALSINAKWCPTLMYTKVVARALKAGDPASISFQAWIHDSEVKHTKLNDAKSLMYWLTEHACEHGGQLICKNLSNIRKNYLAFERNAVPINSFNEKNWMGRQNIDDVLDLYDQTHIGSKVGFLYKIFRELENDGIDVYSYLNKIVNVSDSNKPDMTDEQLFALVVNKFDEYDFQKYFNDKRSETITVRKPETVQVNTMDEETILAEVEHRDDRPSRSFEEMMIDIFGRDFVKAA